MATEENCADFMQPSLKSFRETVHMAEMFLYVNRFFADLRGSLASPGKVMFKSTSTTSHKSNHGMRPKSYAREREHC